ncbi:MAG TPA: hypothetical protein DCQ31_03095 [Bacteroidales bacterium]|nr:hypothetical protein [Bacteroidales bacterium]
MAKQKIIYSFLRPKKLSGINFRWLFSFFIFLVSWQLATAQTNDIATLKEQLTAEPNLKNANTLLRLSEAYMSSSPEKAIFYADDALKLGELLKDTSVIDLALNYLGEGYFNTQSFEKVKYYFEKLLELRLKIGDKKKIAGAYNNLGIVLSYVESYSKALEMYRKALELKKELGNDTGSTLNNIGLLYEKTGKLSEALFYYNESLKEDLKKHDLEGIATTYLNIGDVNRQLNKYSLAEEIYLKGLKIATENGYMLLMKELNEGLYLNFKAAANVAQALKYFEAFNVLKDSIYTDENRKYIAELEVQFRNEQQEKEFAYIALQNKLNQGEIAWQKDINSLIAFFLVSAVVLIGVLYRQFSLKKNAIKLLEKQTTEITDSILYARRIQKAVLPMEYDLNQFLPDKMVFYSPKNIVSGDFCWLYEKENYLVTAVADCTGHGVPGAFMSMLGVTLLKEMVARQNLAQTDAPSQILENLREQIILALRQKGNSNTSKDGMDLALCIMNTKTLEMKFAGAHIGLTIVRNNELITVKPDRMPIGIFVSKTKQFNTQTIQLKQNDSVYIFTDGFQDQIGGEKNRKYLVRNLRNLLLSMHTQPFYLQRTILESEFLKWKSNNKQIDDVLVFGFLVSTKITNLN